MEVVAKKVSKKSLYLLLLKSIGIGLFAFSVLMGIFSIFGFETVNWNNEPIVGINGFLVSIPLGAFLAVFFTTFMWFLGILGLWINSFFGSVTVIFKDVHSPKSTNV